MTDSAGSRDRTPWVVAAVLGIVAIALAAVVIFVIHPDRNDKQALARATGLTSVEQQAVDAASHQALNLTSYSRANFEADYARTVAGASGKLASDLADKSRKSALLAQMQKGKFDLQGQVANAAFETTADGKYSVLVYALSYKSGTGTTHELSSRNRFVLTMQRIGGRWLATDLLSVVLV
jgi:Mce-associated membrane protein